LSLGTSEKYEKKNALVILLSGFYRYNIPIGTIKIASGTNSWYVKKSTET
jgi:hypothetical protein